MPSLIPFPLAQVRRELDRKITQVNDVVYIYTTNGPLHFPLGPNRWQVPVVLETVRAYEAGDPV